MESNHETQTPTPPLDDARGCPTQRYWMTPLALLVVLAVVFTVRAFRQNSNVEQPPAEQTTNDAVGTTKLPTPPPRGETVSLEVDFGNGIVRACLALPWRAGMTVSDVLDAAAKFRPGLRFDRQGEGESAFLQSIEGIAGEGQAGRNWIYYVKNARGQRGIGVHELKSGDAVLWKYEPYE